MAAETRAPGRALRASAAASSSSTPARHAGALRQDRCCCSTDRSARRSPIVRDSGMITLAAAFDCGIDFVKLLELGGGMPTRVSHRRGAPRRGARTAIESAPTPEPQGTGGTALALVCRAWRRFGARSLDRSIRVPRCPVVASWRSTCSTRSATLRHLEHGAAGVEPVHAALLHRGAAGRSSSSSTCSALGGRHRHRAASRRRAASTSCASCSCRVLALGVYQICLLPSCQDGSPFHAVEAV